MKYILFPFKFIFNFLLFLYKIRTVLFILVFIYFLFWLWRFFVVRYKFKYNEEECWMFFGLPGSGKTTLLADIVRQLLKLKKKINIFCNFPIKGTYKISRDQIGEFDLYDQENSQALLCLDEATTVYNKRDSMSSNEKKRVSKRETEFFCMHRHRHTMITCFAQSWDGVDKVVRDISTKLYYVQKSRIRHFIKIRRIAKIFDINQDHQPLDGYEFEKFSSRYIFAPICWKYFDTYDCEKLPDIQKEKWYNSPSPINEPSPGAKAPRLRGWFRGKARSSEIVRSTEGTDANDSEDRQVISTENTN